MSAQLDPEEVQAIADAMSVDAGHKPPATVAERDFSIPRRLSLEVVKRISETLRNLVPSLKRSFQSIVPATVEIEPIAVREITARGLFEGLEPPFIVGRFTNAGAPGWIVWDPSQAIGCVQAALGMPDPQINEIDPSVEISFVERRLMSRALERLVAPLAERFHFQVEGLIIAEKLDDIGSWEDQGADADAHRLCIELSLTALDTTTTVTLYLPGFLPAEVEDHEDELVGKAPPVLRAIPVDVHATFDPIEVPLAQLLEVEVGDVIPIAPIRSARLTLSVGDRPVAHAELGRNYERLAVRILDIIPAHLPEEA